jgi:hypothetical protein
MSAIITADERLAALLHSTGEVKKPPRIMIYGPQKIGKSTFAALAPDPIFLPTEDGQDALRDQAGQPIKVPSFPLARSYEDVVNYIGMLYGSPHDRKTLALDSVDWLEALIWRRVAEDNKVASIEDIGYGKGYVFALGYWRQILDGLNALRDQRGMAIVLIAHAEIKRFEAPDKTASYDRYVPKLHKAAAAVIQEAVDVIGFANWDVQIAEEKAGFNHTVKRGKGSGMRLLHLEERPAFIAGSRYKLPPTIALDWNSFATAFAAATA